MLEFQRQHIKGETMKNLEHAMLSIKELQTFSDSQAEDIEIWKGKVKQLEEENERLKADLIAADARGDE